VLALGCWRAVRSAHTSQRRANGIAVDKDTKVNCPPAAPTAWQDMPYLND